MSVDRKELLEDPLYREIKRELPLSVGRTLANGIITFADFFPGPGEIPSLVADALKFTRMIAQRLGAKRWIDFTPDVGVSAFVLEPIDLATGGALPSHALESSIQLWHDMKRWYRYGRVEVKKARGQSNQEILDYLHKSFEQDRLKKDLERKNPIGSKRFFSHFIACPPTL